MSRVLGAVLFFFTAVFAIASGVLTTFAVAAIVGGLRSFSHLEPMAVGAGSAVAILGIVAATIGVCRLTGVHVPTVRVHLEQSSLLYVAAAGTLIAHMFGEQSNAVAASASNAVIAFAAALVNGVALYGLSRVGGEKVRAVRGDQERDQKHSRG